MKRIAVVMLMLLAVGLTACATTATPPDAAPSAQLGF